MDAEHQKKVEELFRTARDCPPDERETLLSSVSAEMRNEVTSLLADASELPTVTVSSPGWMGLGTMIESYRLESVLGKGGMGTVYRALDTNLNRTVAVKLLSDSFADVTARRRFQREAQTASSLNHPHIVTVHDAGEFDGHQYIVTEFVNGGTLTDWVKKEPRSWREIVELTAGVADGLATAHEANILHRDIKPANILVSKSGYAKLADFGLAKLAAPDDGAASQELTQVGTIAGTLAYMSPEQSCGQAVDARSDIFSFGVLLYELLAGRRPFGGASSSELLHAVIHNAPESLPDTVPARLRQLVEKALKKNPADRFPSMRELVLELRSITKQDPKPARVPGRVWIAAGAVAACLVLAGLAWWMWPQSASRVRSIAVLPFRNLSGDPDQEFLSDGTTEQLISNLTSIRSLKVISRTSVMRYKNTVKGVADIARELGVDALIEGSVQKSANRVRVRARLVGAKSDNTLWSQDYDRDLADALSLETEVARSIASAVRLDLTPTEITRLSGHPIKPEAVEPYLRARYHAFNLNNQDLKEATRLFEEVVQIQPDLAAAHAGIAGAWLTRLSFQGASAKEVEEHARSEAKRAAELDPNSVDAHVNMGMLYTSLDRKWADAEREFREAQRLAPNLPDSYNDYSYMLIVVGRLPEAIAQIEHGLALDPLNPEMHLTYSLALYRSRRYQDAEENYRLTLELDPKNGTAAVTRVALAEARGDYAEALDRLEKLAKAQGQDLSRSMAAARVYGRLGRRADAERTFGKAMETPERVTPIQLAGYYLAVGKKQEALQELQKGADAGRLPILIKTDPAYDDLHSDPGFLAILKQVGLADN